MSSRHMKKVFGSEQDVLTTERVSDDDGPGPATFRRNKALPLNLYEVLNEGTGSSSNSEAEENNAEKDSEKDEETEIAQSQKKKKKKKRKNKKNLASDADTTAASSSSGAKQNSQDSKKVNRKPIAPVKDIPVDTEEKIILRSFGELFGLDPKFLNHEYELRRIFGTKVINQELAASGNRRYRSPGKLVGAREKWPIVTGGGTGLSMELISEDENGIGKYKFHHDRHYQELQMIFMKAVDTFDPNNIVTIVRNHPYHVDSQIQLSALSGEDKQVAAELIELAIHTMESAVHPKFYMSSPHCRLEYKYQENRAFHILLFKHLTFVGLRSTYRCALELCKRLLSLDPDNDPLGVILLIDFYAIKAGECKWFCDLYKFWEPRKNLSQLPNWAYSIALSQFLLSIDGDTNLGVSSSVKSKKGDSAAKKLSFFEKEELGKSSDELLQYSILMFPAVLLTLLQKCGIQCDSRVRNHSYFNSVAQTSSTESLKLLCDLYVWRSHHLWKDPAVLRWLERNANAVLDKVDAKDPRVVDCDAKRRRRYQGTPRNIIRHILIIDEKELTVHLPRDLSKEVILNYDPIPPLDGINIYTEGRLPPTRAGETPEQRGILSALFRSFLFEMRNNNNPAEEPQQVGGAAMRNQIAAMRNERNQAQAAPEVNVDAGNVAGAQGGIAGAAAGLHQSVAVLLDAMRDLLTTTNPTVRDGSDFSSDDEENNPEN